MSESLRARHGPGVSVPGCGRRGSRATPRPRSRLRTSATAGAAPRPSRIVSGAVRRLPLTSVPADENAPVGGLSDIDRLILRSELRDALGSIGTHHRDAVIETVLRDRPYADVAAELGVAPGTLRTRVHYGLRRLRCALETADATA